MSVYKTYILMKHNEQKILVNMVLSAEIKGVITKCNFSGLSDKIKKSELCWKSTKRCHGMLHVLDIDNDILFAKTKL